MKTCKPEMNDDDNYDYDDGDQMILIFHVAQYSEDQDEDQSYDGSDGHGESWC